MQLNSSSERSSSPPYPATTLPDRVQLLRRRLYNIESSTIYVRVRYDVYISRDIHHEHVPPAVRHRKRSCTTHIIVTSRHLTIQKMPFPNDSAITIWSQIQLVSTCAWTATDCARLHEFFFSSLADLTPKSGRGIAAYTPLATIMRLRRGMPSLKQLNARF